MDKRRHERIALGEKGWQATLVDQVSGESLGSVINLSPAGMMLITESEIGVDSVHQVDCIASGPGDSSERFSAGIVVLWQVGANQPQTYWAGLQIIDIDPASQDRLVALSADLAAGD